MKIKRYISIYDRNSDSLISEVKINIDINKLLEIFKPRSNDSELFYIYKIRKKEAKKILLITSFEFDFDKYEYFLECYQE